MEEFRAILSEELATCDLLGKDVCRCLSNIYPILSGIAHGNIGDIVLPDLYHPDDEIDGSVRYGASRASKNPGPRRNSLPRPANPPGVGRIFRLSWPLPPARAP